MRRTDNGNYTLRDANGILFPREHTPSELKLVSQDAIISKKDIYEFDENVAHRGDPGNREYRIRWKNYTADDDTWIKVDNFTDPQSVTDYWKRIHGSVHTKDALQLDKLKSSNRKKVDSPDFHLSSKGPIHKQTDTIADATTESNRSNTSNTTVDSTTGKLGQKKSYKTTQPRTLPTKQLPTESVFRRSTRKKRFTPALDPTKYTK